MKTIKRHILLLGIVASTIYGCGSGSTSNNNSTAQKTPPIGPNSYAVIQAVFEQPSNSQNKTTLSTTGGVCGSVYDSSSSGLLIASGFVSFVPVVGPALGGMAAGIGSVLGMEGASSGNSCLEGEFSALWSAIGAINQQLEIQESQIQNLTEVLNLANNTFYQDNYVNATTSTNNSKILFTNAINVFTGISGGSSRAGLMGNTMIDINFWNAYGGAVIMTESNLGQYMQNNPTWLATNYSVNVDNTPDTQQTFQNNVTYISGAYIPQAYQYESQPYQFVTAQLSNNPQIQMYQALYTQLIESINTQGSNNYIPLYDNYNNTIMQAYQQTVIALQQAYDLEYLNNQTNYYSAMQSLGVSNTPIQIQSYEGIDYTYFNINSLPPGIQPYSAGESQGAINQQTQFFNSAQEQLTLLYAAYMNQAYRNTLNYIVTDSVKGAQTYPSGPTTFIINGQQVVEPNNIDYASILSVGSPGFVVQTPMQYLISATSKYHYKIYPIT